MSLLTIRSSPELDAALDAAVQKLRDEKYPPRVANRSAVVRALLMGALGSRSHKILASETIKRVYAILQSSVNQAFSELENMLPDLVQAELDKTLEVGEGEIDDVEARPA